MVKPLTPGPLTTATVMHDVIASLQPGQKFVYHVGSLMHDRSKGDGFLVVHGAGQVAWNAYQRGEVTLVQKKIGPLKFEYTLIKREPPKPKKAPATTRRGRAAAQKETADA